MQLFLEILSGMANSVDPDKTVPEVAVWSGSTLSANAILSAALVFEILGHLLYASYCLMFWSVCRNIHVCVMSV